MARIVCDFFSEILQLSTSMSVILPQETRGQIGMEGTVIPGKYKTLWLLHGYSDDHTIWCRRTSIERYVSELGLAVVMPQADHSYYTNMAQGRRYWDFIADELPRIARSFFPLSARREDNFVAGLSMGGYGAFKLALRRPECFVAAGSLSGALDVDSPVMKRRNDSFPLIFGKRTAPEDDLFVLAGECREKNLTLPRLFQCCGTEDFLYKDNLRFRDHLGKLDIPLEYREEPGIHEWGFWDRNIQVFLDWLDLKKER